ncbi:hypothetical protein Tco_1156115, partial [Tanacetum coccineum]
MEPRPEPTRAATLPLRVASPRIRRRGKEHPFGERREWKTGTDNQEKDEKQSQNDKTGLGMEKTVKEKAKSKPESQSCQKVNRKFINGPLSVILEAFGEISSYKLIELIAQGIEARAIRTGFLGHSLRKSGLGSETTKI